MGLFDRDIVVIADLAGLLAGGPCQGQDMGRSEETRTAHALWRRSGLQHRLTRCVDRQSARGRLPRPDGVWSV
jgi:hypothetical protein